MSIVSKIIKVDCRKMACPQPVIHTKNALEQMDQGTVITTVDNDIASENITIYAKNNGYQVDVEKKSDIYYITVTKGAPEDTVEKAVTVDAHGDSLSLAYLFSSNVLGQGSPDLGEVLMKSLLVSINEMENPPKALLFLNTGVMLACRGSSVIELLQSLQNKGTQLISCSTCLEYYKLRDKLLVGMMGNMLEINNHMVQSHKVITIS